MSITEGAAHVCECGQGFHFPENLAAHKGACQWPKLVAERDALKLQIETLKNEQAQVDGRGNCSSHACLREKPKGMATNSGKCYCTQGEIRRHMEDMKRLNSEMKAKLAEVERIARKHWDAHPGFAVFVLMALKKTADKAPCSVCKEPVTVEFSSCCVKCGGYSHNNCWAAHNLTYCEKRVAPVQNDTTGCNHRWVGENEDTHCERCGMLFYQPRR